MAANAGKLLVDLVVLIVVSISTCCTGSGYTTYQLDVTLQTRRGLELITTNSAGFTVLIWRCELMIGKILKVGAVHVALVAVVMLVRILLMTLHGFLCVEGLIAVFIRTLDLAEWLEWRWHRELYSTRTGSLSGAQLQGALRPPKGGLVREWVQ